MPRPPIAEPVEPVDCAASHKVVILHDIHYARIEHHRALRRLAGELLSDCLCMSGEQRKLSMAGAAMLARMRAGEDIKPHGRALTREAGQLFGRLPDDPSDALKVLEILSKFIDYIDDGVININGLTDPKGYRSYSDAIDRSMVKPMGHLKLVAGD